MERNKVIKVLQMTQLGAGGISKLMVSINQCVDLDKVKFDYLVFHSEPAFYEELVFALGAKKHVVDVVSIQNKFLVYYKKFMGTLMILQKEKYDVVHINATTPLDTVIGLAAKVAGVPRIVIHSHNAGNSKKSVLILLYMCFCKHLMTFVFTDYLSCSVAAAEYMFPKRVWKNCTIVKNGINTSLYDFDEKNRREARKNLCKEDAFLLGHVGRFSVQKNHGFIVDVFAELCKYQNNALLCLVGSGELEENIKAKVLQLKLQEKVIFYGTTHEVPLLLSAFDAFIFPSLFEGLGIVAIESQCMGLKIFCSENIPEAANISSDFIRVQGYDAETWAYKIYHENYNSRQSREESVVAIGYDILDTAKKIQDLYERKYENLYKT